MNIARVTSLATLLILQISYADQADLQPRFEAASVRVFSEKLRVGLPMEGGPGTSDPGRIMYRGLPMSILLTKAWNIDPATIVGPGWIMDWTQLYTVNATIPRGTTTEQFQLMLQALLVERFNIKYHHETRSVPGFGLVVAKGGSRLKESQASSDTPVLPTGKVEVDKDGFMVLGPGHRDAMSMSVATGTTFVIFQSYTVAEFASSHYLGQLIHDVTGKTSNPVVDRTGLTGTYDIRLKVEGGSAATIAPGVLQGAGPKGLAAADLQSELGDRKSNLFKALEAQLGLNLVKVDATPVDFLIIDHIDKVPQEN
jgi:uncharacterized protein (TIGR03435 family)